MKMKTIPIFFLFIILASFVIAAPPQKSIPSSPNEFEIVYPKIDTVKVHNQFTLHFHVFNASGYLLTNETASCRLHFYHPNGGHQIKEDLEFEGEEWEISINETQNNDTGIHMYNVWCNNSNEGGFVSAEILISETGSPNGYGGDVSTTIAIVLCALLIMFALFTLLSNKPWMKIISFGMILGTILISLNILRIEAESNLLPEQSINMINTTYTSMVWIAWLMASIAFVIGLIWLFETLIGIHKDKRMKPPGGELG